MAKTLLPSKRQEWKGLDRVSPIVHEMGCIFREISKDDFGIDGEIEVVAPKLEGHGLTPTGGIIKVQVKSGESYITRDSETNFTTPVKKEDLQYWYNMTFPVLFIVYHPKEDKLYWKEIKSYIQNIPQVFQAPHHIIFDKAKNEFSPKCYEQICDIAKISPPRISTEQRERLFSNLLLVKRAPRFLTYAPTTYKDWRQIRGQITGFVPPFSIVEGHLYTLSDLRHDKCILRTFCDVNRVEELPTKQWAMNVARRNDYVFLVNQLLRIHLWRCGLKYNRDLNRYYFPRQDEARREFKKDWFNIRTSRAAPARGVVKYYTYGRHQFWRHLAVSVSFICIGTSWFLQIVPQYLFTEDGETPCPGEIASPYTTGIKAQQRNIHVLNHLFFWVDILSQHKPAIEIQLDFKTVMVLEKEPLSGIANFAIPFDPAIYEELDAEQLDFPGLLSSPLAESEHDEY